MTDRAKLLETLQGLAKKRDVSLWSLKPPEQGLVLMSFTQTISPGETFTEREFSARLEAWLRRHDGFLRTDFAELRRTLVDLRFFERDASGAAYRRAPDWPERWRAQCKAVEDAPLSELLAQARVVEVDQREARKRLALSRA